MLYRHSGKRCTAGRFPYDNITCDSSNECIPGPHGYWEIKCGNNSYWSQGVPLFIHAVVGAFRVHCLTIKHARLSYGKISNINHFLNFADTFFLNFSHFQRYKISQRILFIPQRIAHFTDQITPHRCWYHAPLIKGRLCLFDYLFIVVFIRFKNGGNLIFITRINGCIYPSILCFRPITSANAAAKI